MGTPYYNVARSVSCSDGHLSHIYPASGFVIHPPTVISNRPAAETPPTTTATPSRPTSPPPVQHCAPYTENTRKNIKRKKARMQLVNTPGFVEIETSLKRTIVWYFRKNVDNIASYRAFLHSLEPELIDKLRECVRIQPIKYNLKLEATYAVPNQDESVQNRAFKTCARELFAYSDVVGSIDRDLTALLAEEDAWRRRKLDPAHVHATRSTRVDYFVER